MRVIVTGAGGYLGGQVVSRLAQDGHTITALVRDATNASAWLQERARVVSCNLARPLETATFEDHDACVHLAVLWPEQSAQPEIDDVTASARVFDALGRAQVGHVVYVSSAAVHRPFTGTMRESDRLFGADAYGAAKIAGEAFLRASAATHGFRASVVRPGPCVGLAAEPNASPKTPNAIAEMHRSLVGGRVVRVVEGEGRQLTACADLATTICRVLTDPTAPHVLLCTDREITTWTSIAERLADRLSRRSLIEITPRERTSTVPTFDTSEIERFLGRALHAGAAVEKHLDRLITSIGQAR